LIRKVVLMRSLASAAAALALLSALPANNALICNPYAMVKPF